MRQMLGLDYHIGIEGKVGLQATRRSRGNHGIKGAPWISCNTTYDSSTRAYLLTLYFDPGDKTTVQYKYR